MTEIIQVTDSRKYLPRGPHVGQPSPALPYDVNCIFYQFFYYYQWIFIAHEVLASTQIKLHI